MYAEKDPGFSALPYEQERLVILVNPISSNISRAQAYIDEVKQVSGFSNAVVLETEKEADATTDKLSGVMRDGDLLYVLSGDGVLNIVTQYAGNVEAPDFSIMTSDIGDACNAYRSTTDRRLTNPADIIMHGLIAPINPLRATVEMPDVDIQPDPKLALTVLSVGAMATGAVVLGKHRNDRWYRNPKTRDNYQKLLAVLTMPQLHSLEVEGLGNNDPHSMMDFTAANAATIAKHFRYPTSISEHDFVYHVIKDRLRLAPDVLRMQYGNWPVEFTRLVANKESVSFRLTDSERNSQALIQYDGEPEPLLPGSTITVDQPGFDDPTHRPIWAVFAR